MQALLCREGTSWERAERRAGRAYTETWAGLDRGSLVARVQIRIYQANQEGLAPGMEPWNLSISSYIPGCATASSTSSFVYSLLAHHHHHHHHHLHLLLQWTSVCMRIALLRHMAPSSRSPSSLRQTGRFGGRRLQNLTAGGSLMLEMLGHHIEFRAGSPIIPATKSVLCWVGACVLLGMG